MSQMLKDFKRHYEILFVTVIAEDARSSKGSTGKDAHECEV